MVILVICLVVGLPLMAQTDPEVTSEATVIVDTVVSGTVGEDVVVDQPVSVITVGAIDGNMLVTGFLLLVGS